jgi:hypothetical protein
MRFLKPFFEVSNPRPICAGLAVADFRNSAQVGLQQRSLEKPPQIGEGLARPGCIILGTGRPKWPVRVSKIFRRSGGGSMPNASRLHRASAACIAAALCLASNVTQTHAGSGFVLRIQVGHPRLAGPLFTVAGQFIFLLIYAMLLALLFVVKVTLVRKSGRVVD